MEPTPPRWQTVALVAAAVVTGLVLRLVTFTGLIASDDLTHVWAAEHVWHDPVEHSMPDGPGSPYVVNARRAGVNLPLAAAAALAGPREAALAAVPLIASLVGAVLLAIAAGLLAGRRAAVLAAWLTAVLPVDVWHATVILQDSLFACGLAGVLAALAWAERDGDRRGGARPWLVAGAALGYLQYVKESAAVLLVALVALGAWRSLAPGRPRVVHRGTLWLVAGFALVQALATVYFAIAFDDAGYYLRTWLGRQADVEAIAAPRPFPHNLVRLGLYVTWGGALGVGVPLALGPGARWLIGDVRRARAAAVTLAVLLIAQLAITVHVLRWGAWTMRYLLQVTPLCVLLAAIGVSRTWTARPRRARAALDAGVIALTALGLVYGHPQHGRFRSQLLREAAVVITRDVPADVPVVVARGPHAGHYADRALAILAGPRPGGWTALDAAAVPARAALVYSNLERHPAPPSPAPGPVIYQGATRGGRDWLVVYAIGIPAPPRSPAPGPAP